MSCEVLSDVDGELGVGVARRDADGVGGDAGDRLGLGGAGEAVARGRRDVAEAGREVVCDRDRPGCVGGAVVGDGDGVGGAVVGDEGAVRDFAREGGDSRDRVGRRAGARGRVAVLVVGRGRRRGGVGDRCPCEVLSDVDGELERDGVARRDADGVGGDAGDRLGLGGAGEAVARGRRDVAEAGRRSSVTVIGRLVGGAVVGDGDGVGGAVAGDEGAVQGLCDRQRGDSRDRVGRRAGAEAGLPFLSWVGVVAVAELVTDVPARS